MSEINPTYHTANDDISRVALSIAREIDRLPKGTAASVYLRKDKRGRIVHIEICTQERLRLWVPETVMVG